jgi:hypothetical protein
LGLLGGGKGREEENKARSSRCEDAEPCCHARAETPAADNDLGLAWMGGARAQRLHRPAFASRPCWSGKMGQFGYCYGCTSDAPTAIRLDARSVVVDANSVAPSMEVPCSAVMYCALLECCTPASPPQQTAVRRCSPAACLLARLACLHTGQSSPSNVCCFTGRSCSMHEACHAMPNSASRVCLPAYIRLRC